MKGSVALPFARPLCVMLKPVGASCNLACRYCYYLEKGATTPGGTGLQAMSDGLLEEFTRQYIEAQTMPQVLFTWHGGEPLLRPISFYQNALRLQRKYARGRHIDNCIQTNGTLINDEWCRFFRDNGFLVGISIDGPEELHNTYRRTKDGGPTFADVMRGISLLQRHGVEWNAMATVNSVNVGHPRRFYRFFRETGCQYLQFTPVVERFAGSRLASPADEAAQLAPFSVTPIQWGRFLCGVYDEWVEKDIGKVFVQLFDATLANWAGEPPGLCSMSAYCGQAAAMEANGDVYPCDHYVFPEYRLGNIRQRTIAEMLYGQRQTAFGLSKSDALTRQCRECEYLFACHGECPRNRFAYDCYGNPGHNYLCEGYRQFFSHVATDMNNMKAALDAGLSPAIIRQCQVS